MTFEQLQEFLDAEKWEDSVEHSCDMCGRYARCRYCVRTEETPCAMAHNRMVAATTAPVPDMIPDWLLPEPDVEAKFGTNVAEAAPALSETEQAAPALPETQQDAPALPETQQDAPAPEAPQLLAPPPEQLRIAPSAPVYRLNAAVERPRPHVVRRGKGEIRIALLHRRQG